MPVCCSCHEAKAIPRAIESILFPPLYQWQYVLNAITVDASAVSLTDWIVDTQLYNCCSSRDKIKGQTTYSNNTIRPLCLWRNSLTDHTHLCVAHLSPRHADRSRDSLVFALRGVGDDSRPHLWLPSEQRIRGNPCRKRRARSKEDAYCFYTLPAAGVLRFGSFVFVTGWVP